MAAIDPAACARIAKLWLQLAEIYQFSGQPAAFIALRVAQTVVKKDLCSRGHLERGTAKTAYEALLAAARELPDEVSALVLKLRRRHETEFKARWVPLLPRESAKKTF